MSNMEICITICKIDSQQEFSVWLRELKQGLCINLEGMGWVGRWEGVSKGGDICRERRQWHPTPVLLPGESHGQRSLEGCSPWGC